MDLLPQNTLWRRCQGEGQGPSSGGGFVPWLDETANVGAQRADFAPWLGETANVGAQRGGFAPLVG